MNIGNRRLSKAIEGIMANFDWSLQPHSQDDFLPHAPKPDEHWKNSINRYLHGWDSEDTSMDEMPSAPMALPMPFFPSEDQVFGPEAAGLAIHQGSPFVSHDINASWTIAMAIICRNFRNYIKEFLRGRTVLQMLDEIHQNQSEFESFEDFLKESFNNFSREDRKNMFLSKEDNRHFLEISDLFIKSLEDFIHGIRQYVESPSIDVYESIRRRIHRCMLLSEEICHIYTDDIRHMIQ
jgi:hypothetical protein